MMRYVIFFFLACLLSLPAHAIQDEQVTASYSSSHREVKELMAAIQPLYQGELVFSLVGNKIFIRGDADLAGQAISILEEMDQPQRHFRLRLSDGKPNPSSKTYSTGKSPLQRQQSFAISEGKPLVIVNKSESEQFRAAGPFWYETETVIDSMESIKLSIDVLADDRIELSYQLYNIDDSRHQAQSGSAVVPLNEWYSLSGDTNQNRSWSTSKRGNRDLYIKLETY